jgi:hypothetical protein
MHLIRLILAAQQRNADRQILRFFRRDSRRDDFLLELERRLLGH